MTPKQPGDLTEQEIAALRRREAYTEEFLERCKASFGLPTWKDLVLGPPLWGVCFFGTRYALKELDLTGRWWAFLPLAVATLVSVPCMRHWEQSRRRCKKTQDGKDVDSSS